MVHTRDIDKERKYLLEMIDNYGDLSVQDEIAFKSVIDKLIILSRKHPYKK